MGDVVDPYEGPQEEPTAGPKIDPKEGAQALSDAIESGAVFMGSDLAEPEPEEIPPPPEESQPPPEGDWVSRFLVGKDYRSVYIASSDGAMEPLGIFLTREHPHASGAEVAAWLANQGLPERSAVWYGRQRTQAQHTEEDVIVIPDDIERVWGQGKLDGMGLPAINTARALIAKWGIEGFRNSAIHKAALAEIKHDEDKDEFARAYIAAQKKKGAYVAPPRGPK